MASRTSMTGVAVSSGYPQLLHVSDTGGLHATTLRQIYDGDGTASALYLATETAKFVIGTDAGDDFIVNNATDNMILAEGDLCRVTIDLDGTADADFAVVNASTDMLRISSDNTIVFTPTSSMSVVIGTDASDDFFVSNGTDNLLLCEGDVCRVTLDLDGTANADFAIVNGATDILRLESDAAFTITPTTALAVVIGTDAGDDFTVNDGTDDLIHVSGDLGSVVINLATASGNDFAVNDGTIDLILVEPDQATVEFKGDIMLMDGAYDFDVASHDGTNGLMLGGVLVGSSAIEIDRVADISTRLVTLAATGAVTVAAHAERDLLLAETGNDAEMVITLPAASGSFARFRFFQGAVNTNNHIVKVADASTVIDGTILSLSDGSDNAIGWTTAATSDTITLDGTTTGGVCIGDWFELIDIAANQWVVRGITTSTGTEATPFSATVS